MPLFEALEDVEVRERWRRFAASLPLRRVQRPDPDDGFLPLEQAATVMELDVRELVAMVRRGELEHRKDAARGVLVRPAIVSKLAVRTGARVMS